MFITSDVGTPILEGNTDVGEGFARIDGGRVRSQSQINRLPIIGVALARQCQTDETVNVNHDAVLFVTGASFEFSQRCVTASMYDSLYLRWGNEGILQRIHREALQDQELASLHCNGFLAHGDLQRFLSVIGSCFHNSTPKRRNKTLLDLGCGFGGLGRWLSEKLGCRLVGIDAHAVGGPTEIQGRGIRTQAKSLGGSAVVLQRHDQKWIGG